MRNKYFVPLLLSLLVFAGCAVWGAPENHIFFIIGDGLGPEHEELASYYLTGAPDSLVFHDFPYKGEVSTASADSAVTDSAAAATAYATGASVDNGVISTAIPGDSRDLVTILDLAGSRGFLTGVITTSFLTHATPAAFLSHASTRDAYTAIGTGILSSGVYWIMGGGGNGLSEASLRSAGYEVITGTADLGGRYAVKTAFLYGNTHIPYVTDRTGSDPALNGMVSAYLDHLDGSGIRKSIVMIEAARIEHASHDNDEVRALHELLELNTVVGELIQWSDTQPAGSRISIIVTADHETGGLNVTSGNGAGNLPNLSWSTGGHTGVNVSLYVDAPLLPDTPDTTGPMENEEIFEYLQRLVYQ